MPKAADLTRAEPPLRVEIVTHCWNYSQFLVYQLSSLVKYPPKECQITHTVFYSTEDPVTVRLLDYYKKLNIPTVCWNFCDLPKEALFRRSIGRNIAAKASKADWVWFTDCDVLFHEHALDSLARRLIGSQEILVYPQTMWVSPRLDDNDPIIEKGRELPSIPTIDTSQFTPRKQHRAMGPIQIVHGDVARACGYCDSLPVYQKSTDHWRKAYEDRAFRWLLGTHGVPMDIPNVFFIRHAEKGRYQKNNPFSVVRKAIRKLQFALFDR